MAGLESDQSFEALFKRYPAQTEHHQRYQARLSTENPDLSPDVISAIADKKMEAWFYEQLSRQADWRISEIKADVFNRDLRFKDHAELRPLVLASIVAELAVWHEALPLPMAETAGVAA